MNKNKFTVVDCINILLKHIEKYSDKYPTISSDDVYKELVSLKKIAEEEVKFLHNNAMELQNNGITTVKD